MIKGIHHITAIASNAQDNLDFYNKILGLRLVKKTVNQDDTGTYHLFFGDKHGSAGMDLTFFIFLPSMAGINGNGFVTKISLAVPKQSLGFWEERLTSYKVVHGEIAHYIGHDRLQFVDRDGQQLELVGLNNDELGPSNGVWVTKEISLNDAIRHFHSATLTVPSLESIESILTEVFDYSRIDHHEDLYLYKTNRVSGRGDLLELNVSPHLAVGMSGAGTVHHIAFRADSDQHQLALRQKVIDIGLYPTEVINRYYFKSVYFRTRAGILFEIATDGPGFTSDESVDSLGTHLSLPPFLESKRKVIEANLMPLTYDPAL